MLSVTIGGILFLKQTANVSSDESMEMMHPSDYQEQAQQPLSQNSEENSEEYDEETQKNACRTRDGYSAFKRYWRMRRA